MIYIVLVDFFSLSVYFGEAKVTAKIHKIYKTHLLLTSKMKNLIFEQLNN